MNKDPNDYLSDESDPSMLHTVQNLEADVQAAAFPNPSDCRFSKNSVHAMKPDFNHGKAVPTTFFVNSSSSYAYIQDDGHAAIVPKATMLDMLAQAGIPKAKDDDEELSPAARFLISISHKYRVDAIVQLSGYPAGRWLSTSGKTILTPSSPSVPTSEPPLAFWNRYSPFPDQIKLANFCPVIWGIVNGVFSDPDDPSNDQLIAILYNLQNRLAALHSSLNSPASVHSPLPVRYFRPAQAILIAGDSGTGKTTYAQIHKATLGGSAIDPTQFFLGETSFNSDLVSATSLILDDSLIQSDPKDRIRLANAIKKRVAEPEITCHPKGQVPFSIPVLHSIIACCNCEASALKALPLLDGSSADKIHILRSSQAILPQLPASLSAEEKWAETLHLIQAELPLFRSYLLSGCLQVEFPIPPHLADLSGRFPTRAYSHPTLFAVTQADTPELDLLQLLDELLMPSAMGPWTGTSSQLSSRLQSLIENITGKPKPDQSLQDLCASSRKLGRSLAILASIRPNRIKALPVTHGLSKWLISLP